MLQNMSVEHTFFLHAMRFVLWQRHINPPPSPSAPSNQLREVITILTESCSGQTRGYNPRVLFCEERISVVIHHIAGNKTKTLTFQTK